MGSSGRLDDPHRLAALHATGLLDSPTEESFDRLTRLASRLLGTPVALVSLVDDERQFFKSQVGLREPWASERQTALSHSFCQHVVASGEPLVISDARADETVAGNPAIDDLGVVAYAGYPIRTQTGTVVGSFCVIDEQPRNWAPDELQTLADLTASVVAEVELRAAIRGTVQAYEERAGLARDVHDLILQCLATAKLALELGRLPALEAALTEGIAAARSLAAAAPGAAVPGSFRR